MVKKISADTNALTWFEIPVMDLDRAKKFYQTILDIEMQTQHLEDAGEDMAFFPRKPDTIMAQSGILSGALVKGERMRPGMHGALVYLNAYPEIDTVIEKVESAGGKVLQPKVKIPAGFIAIIADTEGNKLGIHASQ